MYRTAVRSPTPKAMLPTLWGLRMIQQPMKPRLGPNKDLKKRSPTGTPKAICKDVPTENQILNLKAVTPYDM